MSTPHGKPAPATPQGVTRRTAVKLALVGLAGVAIGAGTTPLLRSLRSPTRRHRFLTDDEAALLIGICEQLIPADDAPGAADTGAIDFIDRQLGHRHRKHQTAYRRGLAAFRETCTQAYGRAFAELTSAQKIEVLRAVEAGTVPPGLWREPTAPAFFNLVLAHTMQSFYGSPRHGGNRAYASYRMLGLDYPAIAGQNRHPTA